MALTECADTLRCKYATLFQAPILRYATGLTRKGAFVGILFGLPSNAR